MSSLSGEEGDGDDDDEEPLAARVAQQSPSKSPKKPTAGKTAKSAPTGRMPTSTTGQTNGFVEPEPRIKIEDKMDDAQLDRLATGVPVDSETTAVSLCDPPFCLRSSADLMSI